jgi:hypothetical protein
MGVKSSMILAFLFLLQANPVKSESDSLTFHPPGLERPQVYSISGHNDSLAYMHLYHINQSLNNNPVSPQQMSFYRNLEKAADRRYITRWLHELIIKDPVSEYLPSDHPHRGESLFAEYEGKTIQNIILRTASLFAPSIDEYYHSSSSRFERAVSLLHFSTNEKIIRNNLLFETGDNIDPFLIADNERILRQLSYIEDARIYIYENAINPEFVDIVIFTKDRWSHGFDMNMGEIDKGEILFYNKNILGLGQEASLGLLVDASEDSPLGLSTGLKINNIGRSFVSSGINYRNGSGNRVFNIRSGRNFITPSMKYAGGFEFNSSRLVDDYIFPDMTYLDQQLDFNEYDSWFGRSFQLPGRDADRRNIFITTRFNRTVFYERPDIWENLRYDFHNSDIALLGLTYTRMAYLKSNYIYGFGPTEDIPLGSKFETVAGYEDNQFFSRWYTSLSISHSSYIENRAFIQNSISLGGFINDGTFEQGVLNLGASGFSTLVNVNGYYLRQFFNIGYTRGFARFDDEYISISNRNGIRGLRSDMLNGSQKLTMQLETMLYSRKNWYGFRYALFTMADLGWIGSGSSLLSDRSFYSGLGIGMNVRNEHLVFPTLKFRLAWFPRIPEQANVRWLYIMSERNRTFDEFDIREPGILPYR